MQPSIDLVIGDDWNVKVPCSDLDGTVEEEPNFDGATITACVASVTGEALTAYISQVDSAPEADWPNGTVSVQIPAATSILAQERKGVLINIRVVKDGKRTTWRTKPIFNIVKDPA